MSVLVTRMDDGDFGSERRVEVEMDGRTIELVVASDGRIKASLWLLGRGGRSPYHTGTQLWSGVVEDKQLKGVG